MSWAGWRWGRALGICVMQKDKLMKLPKAGTTRRIFNLKKASPTESSYYKSTSLRRDLQSLVVGNEGSKISTTPDELGSTSITRRHWATQWWGAQWNGDCDMVTGGFVKVRRGILIKNTDWLWSECLLINMFFFAAEAPPIWGNLSL